MLGRDFGLFLEFATPRKKCLLNKVFPQGYGYVLILTAKYNGVHVNRKALKTSHRGPVNDTCLNGIL